MCTACDECKKWEKKKGYYNVLENGKNTCTFIAYQAKIGDDLDTALDSLIKWNAFYLIDKEYYVKKENLTVDFRKDDRLFYKICFIDANFPYGDSYEVDLFMPSVLDSYGNHYNFVMPED